MTPETLPETITRLLKGGGHALVVGGYMEEKFGHIDHPQLRLWDDVKQRLNAKNVPLNTRAILFTRLCSHQTSLKLVKAARKMHIPVLKLVEVNELRQVLAGFAPPPKVKVKEPIIVQGEVQEEVPALPSPQIDNAISPKEDMAQALRAARRGEIVALVDELSQNDGTPIEEARRLLPLIRQRGIEVPLSALSNAVRNRRIHHGTHVRLRSSKKKVEPLQPVKPVKMNSKIKIKAVKAKTSSRKSSKSAPVTEMPNNDPFAQVESILADARRLLKEAGVALSLGIAAVRELDRETHNARARDKKLRELFLSQTR